MSKCTATWRNMNEIEAQTLGAGRFCADTLEDMVALQAFHFCGTADENQLFARLHQSTFVCHEFRPMPTFASALAKDHSARCA